MTMDVLREHVEYLATRLRDNVVTYKTASRDLDMHVSRSKQLLWSYYLANRSRTNASFIVSGTHHSGTKIAYYDTQNELETRIHDEFDDVACVHVYSLTLTEASFSLPQVALEELKQPCGEVEKLWQIGFTEGPAKIPVGKAPSETAPAAPKPVSEAEHKPEPKAAAKPKAPSITSKYVSRKTENKDVAPKKRGAAQTPLTYQYKSRKTEAKPVKERVVMSTGEDGGTDDLDSVKAASRVPTTDLNQLFLDDMSDFSEDDNNQAPVPEAAEPIAVEHEESEHEDQEPETETVEKKSGPLDGLASDRLPSPAAPPREASREPTVDEDGYITTYRASDTKPEAAQTDQASRTPSVAPKRILKPPKKGDGKKKQASLMSFFGKS